MKRRDFVTKTAQAGLAVSALGMYACDTSKKEQKKIASEFTENSNKLFFKISLAQWSFHQALIAQKMDPLDFAAKSRSLGCEGLEYVNAFYEGKATNMPYLNEMNIRAEGEGQKNVLIMIDDEGNLADSTTSARLRGIENHYKWVDAAHKLGCHAIRVNLAGGKDKSDAVKAGVDSLTKLSDYAKGSKINILVENHGGFSSNGQWMQQVFSQVKNKNCGTLPDFGNFCITRTENGDCVEAYDPYKGIKELLPFAKAVSAKSYAFDTHGNETSIDYFKMMKMVKEVEYNGFVGIEYEGSEVSEDKGVALTRSLLIKVGKQLS